MTTKIVVPVLGGVEWNRNVKKHDVATVVEWKANEGAQIEKGDILSSVETEKVSCDVEAEASGLLHILVEKGKKVAIGTTVIGFIADTNEELEEFQKMSPHELAQKCKE